MSPEGPLWFRGYATWTDEEGTKAIAGILRRYDARRFVAAHTVVGENRIATRFDDRLYLIDTLEPSALVIQDSRLAPFTRPKENSRAGTLSAPSGPSRQCPVRT